MVEQARAVIIGGGIGGTSIAYHLAELGWKYALRAGSGGCPYPARAAAPGQEPRKISRNRGLEYRMLFLNPK